MGNRYREEMTAACYDMMEYMSMPDGLDAKEIGELIGINQRAAKKRLERAGIKPIGYSGPAAIYDPSLLWL
jgi:hypothetical protein